MNCRQALMLSICLALCTVQVNIKHCRFLVMCHCNIHRCRAWSNHAFQHQGKALRCHVSLLQEYGLPSSHTLNSLCLNFYIVHYLFDKHLLPSNWALVVYLGTAVWVAWIGLARVYMGLHTPIDIGAGALLGTLVLVFYLAIDGTQHYARQS